MGDNCDENEPIDLPQDNSGIELERTVIIDGVSNTFTKVEATVSNVLASLPLILYNFLNDNRIRGLIDLRTSDEIQADATGKRSSQSTGQKEPKTIMFLKDLQQLGGHLANIGREPLKAEQQYIFNTAFSLCLSLSKNSNTEISQQALALIKDICTRFLVKGSADAFQFLSCGLYAHDQIERDHEKFLLEAIFAQSSDKPAALVAAAILPYVISNSKSQGGPDLIHLFMRGHSIRFLKVNESGILEKIAITYDDLLKSGYNTILPDREKVDYNVEIITLLNNYDISKIDLQQMLLNHEVITSENILDLNDENLIIMSSKLANATESMEYFGKIQNFEKMKFCIDAFKENIFKDDTEYDPSGEYPAVNDASIFISILILFMNKYKQQLFQYRSRDEMKLIASQASIIDCCKAHDFMLRIMIELFHRVLPNSFDDATWKKLKEHPPDDNKMIEFMFDQYDILSAISNANRQKIQFNKTTFIQPTVLNTYENRQNQQNLFILENTKKIFSDFTQGKMINWNDRNLFLSDIHSKINIFIDKTLPCDINSEAFWQWVYPKIFIRLLHPESIATSFDSANPPNTGKKYINVSADVDIPDKKLKIVTRCIGTNNPYTNPNNSVLLKKYVLTIFDLYFPLNKRTLPETWQLRFPRVIGDNNSMWLNLILESFVTSLKTDKTNAISVPKIKINLKNIFDKIISCPEPAPDTIKTYGCEKLYQSIQEINDYVSAEKMVKSTKSNKKSKTIAVNPEEILIDFLSNFMECLEKQHPSKIDSKINILMNWISMLLAEDVTLECAILANKNIIREREKIEETKQCLNTNYEGKLTEIARRCNIFENNGRMLDIVTTIFEASYMSLDINLNFLELQNAICENLLYFEDLFNQPNLDIITFWDLYKIYAQGVSSSSRKTLYRLLNISDKYNRGRIVAAILFVLIKNTDVTDEVITFLQRCQSPPPKNMNIAIARGLDSQQPIESYSNRAIENQYDIFFNFVKPLMNQTIPKDMFIGIIRANLDSIFKIFTSLKDKEYFYFLLKRNLNITDFDDNNLPTNIFNKIKEIEENKDVRLKEIDESDDPYYVSSLEYTAFGDTPVKTGSFDFLTSDSENEKLGFDESNPDVSGKTTDVLGLIYGSQNFHLLNEWGDNDTFNRELQPIGLRSDDVEHDGSCFFHAVEAQLIKDRNRTMNFNNLRATAIGYLDQNRNEIMPFVAPESVENYITRMSLRETWVDEIAIRALAKSIGINILIINNRHVNNPAEWTFISCDVNGAPTITIGHIGELHYTSIVSTTPGGTNLLNQIIGIHSSDLSDTEKRQALSNLARPALLVEGSQYAQSSTSVENPLNKRKSRITQVKDVLQNLFSIKKKGGKSSTKGRRSKVKQFTKGKKLRKRRGTMKNYRKKNKTRRH